MYHEINTTMFNRVSPSNQGFSIGFEPEIRVQFHTNQHNKQTYIPIYLNLNLIIHSFFFFNLRQSQQSLSLSLSLSEQQCQPRSVPYPSQWKMKKKLHSFFNKHHREPHFIDQLEQEEDEEDDDDDQQEQDEEEDEQGEEEEDDEEEAEEEDDEDDDEEGQHHDDEKEKSQGNVSAFCLSTFFAFSFFITWFYSDPIGFSQLGYA
jgi:hypothetical protein